ncbi:MAG TPA: hypothetical protein V6C58_14425, partial [Allocoleopsis sp.]
LHFSADPKYTSYCLYKLKSYKTRFDVFEQEGTVFGSITKDGFNQIISIIPDEKVINNFNNLVLSMDLKIFNNEKQIQTITKIRDELLPKLMSGEIRVKDKDVN